MDGFTQEKESSSSVIAAVIEKNRKFLICQRSIEKRHGLLWEFPGGKLESGESLADAAVRELMEELELTVTDVGPILLAVLDEASGFQIQFTSVRVTGDPVKVEHHDIGWFSPEEILELALAPSDRVFAEFLNRKS